VRRANVAVPEKAVVDALWRHAWEGENISHVIYCLIEQPLDFELLVRYAREKGRPVEGRLRTVLEALSRATGKSYGAESLRPGEGGRFREKVEVAVEDVLSTCEREPHHLWVG
jgi:hypothetical protein